MRPNSITGSVSQGFFGGRASGGLKVGSREVLGVRFRAGARLARQRGRFGDYFTQADAVAETFLFGHAVRTGTLRQAHGLCAAS